ncbi:MAG TPA: hypothetical protein PLC40_00600 [Candidatus Hydrogenedentes bacterium]|nr:hypothetical protein [Candidatus Hydrogenedentota bacterium]
MDDEKKFNCVEMKNRIQAALIREYDGLSSEEVRRKRHNKLASSNSPAARMWQAAMKRRATI